MGYFIAFVNLAAIYGALSVSLNIICGYAGLLSVAHAAFFGIGAYAAALLQTRAHLDFLTSMAVASLAAGLAGAAVGYPSMRLRGDYLLMATLGFGEIFRSLVVNWPEVTGGHTGIRGIPYPTILGFSFRTEASFLVLTLGLLGLFAGLSWLLERSPFGQAMISVGEDEEAAAVLGRDPVRFKVLAMALGAGMAGAAGALYAGYTTFISPGSFTLSDSVLVLAMVLLGGIGSVPGAVAGAFLLLALPEALRFAGLSSPVANVWRQMLYGVALMVVMALRPRGLLGNPTLGVARGGLR